MARSKETPHTASTETDDVQQSLELLDRVLLEFEDSGQVKGQEGAGAEPPPPPEEAERLISALMPRGSPRGSPGQSLRRSPPDPGGTPSPSQATAATQTTLPKARHIGSKKLSSRFGSLPFDLSSHAAPLGPPPWLQALESKGQRGMDGVDIGRETGGIGDRNMLRLPIQNPLTTSLHPVAPLGASGSEEEEEEQFSDDSLEGQVSSSDREADFADMGSTTSRECGEEDAEGEGGGRQRGSIAWDIPLDWDLDEAAGFEGSSSKKRRREEIPLGGSRSQPQTPSCPPVSVAISGGGTYVIRDKKRRPALEGTFIQCPVIPTSATFSAGLNHHNWQHKEVEMAKGISLPSLQAYKQPSFYSKIFKKVPEPNVENHFNGPQKRPVPDDTCNIKQSDEPIDVDESPIKSSVLHELCNIAGSKEEKEGNCEEDNGSAKYEAEIMLDYSGEEEKMKENEKEQCLLPEESANEEVKTERNSILSSSDIKMECNNITEKEQKPKIIESEIVTPPIKEENSFVMNGEEIPSTIDVFSENLEPMKTSPRKVIESKSGMVQEIGCKIMRRSKGRPNSMPPNDGNILLFKTAVQLEPLNAVEAKQSKMRPMSMPPYDQSISVTHISANNQSVSCEKLDQLLERTENTKAASPLTKLPENRPQSVYVANSSPFTDLKSRPMSCTDLNFPLYSHPLVSPDKICNSLDNDENIKENISSHSKNTEIFDSTPPDSIEVQLVENLSPKNQPLPYNSIEVQSVPISSDIIVSNGHREEPENISRIEVEIESHSFNETLQLNSEPEVKLEQEEDEVPSVPCNVVNSLVQTDISVLSLKRNHLGIDSPSEEQVVPSLSYRTSTLLTPDEASLDKSLSLVVMSNLDIEPSNIRLPTTPLDFHGDDVMSRPENNKNCETTSHDHLCGILKPTPCLQTQSDNIHVVETETLVNAEWDSVKPKDMKNGPQNECYKRPVDLLPRKSSLECKLSRDSHRRKSHGSSLEMATKAMENRRSAPESSFLFQQGHYTIPLSFAVTNKPSGKSQHSNKENSSTEEKKNMPVEKKQSENIPVDRVHDEPKVISPKEKSEVKVNCVDPTKTQSLKPRVNGDAKRHRHSDLPPPPPPHQNLTPVEDEYAVPRSVPAFGSNAKRHQGSSRPSRPKNLNTGTSSKQIQPPLPPPHAFEAEKPLPPTPQTPVQTTKLSILEDFDTHPLPPSPHSPKPPRPLPTSATFPVPPSPSSIHRVSRSSHVPASPQAGRSKTITPPGVARPPSPRQRGTGPHPLPHPLPSPLQQSVDSNTEVSNRVGPRRPLPSPPESDYGFAIRDPGTTGLGSLKTRSVDAGLGRGLREQLATSISQARELGSDQRTLPTELSGATPRRHISSQYSTGLRQGKKKGKAPTVPPHASLPETPVFARGCDIPRAPYRPPAVGIPVLRSSLSEEGDRLVLCGPARGWYPKHRQNKPAVSTENLDQASSIWGEPRKPQTLPPNLHPPKFFHRSPREALRRVTSLLIRRGNTNKESRAAKEVVPSSGASGSQCETPQRQKRSFFRNFWKKSKHYSLEQ